MVYHPEMNNEVQKLIEAEQNRQSTQINLIPSENITSEAVRAAVGSVLMHKYSEGNIGARYYEGNEFIDKIEQLTLNLATNLFKLPSDWGVNVQALSGSNANLASLLAILEPGDTILSMYLPDGGHLSHGWSYDKERKSTPKEKVYEPGERKVHIVSKLYNVIQYKTDPSTQLIDYTDLKAIAQEYQPKLIITGGTAYPRDIDYKKVREIADSVDALYLADIAHEAGLIAAGVIPSPVGIADVVTMTTHKTLRSARGAIILGHQTVIKKINKAVLPGLQGGPFNNNIAGICVGLAEALQPEFVEYAKQIVKNTQVLVTEFKKRGYSLVSGGADKHLILINLQNKYLTGKQASKALASVGIITNMNTIPGELRSPANPSGLRLGTPFVTTQGLKETEMQKIVEMIDIVLSSEISEEGKLLDSNVARSISSQVSELMNSVVGSQHT